MKYIITLLITLSATAVLAAATSGHGDEHAIPFQLIGYQTFNVVIMIAGLIYFLKTPVQKHFAHRRDNYLSEARKAETLRKAAEQERSEIQKRLNQLETTADESISRARAEAADLKNQLVLEAQALSKRIRDEASQAARQESERARYQLKEELIRESLKIAREQIAKKVTTEDHQRLQANFLQNIQAVQK